MTIVECKLKKNRIVYCIINLLGVLHSIYMTRSKHYTKKLSSFTLKFQINLGFIGCFTTKRTLKSSTSRYNHYISSDYREPTDYIQFLLCHMRTITFPCILTGLQPLEGLDQSLGTDDHSFRDGPRLTVMSYTLFILYYKQFKNRLLILTHFTRQNLRNYAFNCFVLEWLQFSNNDTIIIFIECLPACLCQ